jgi:hypothetical protein
MNRIGIALIFLTFAVLACSQQPAAAPITPSPGTAFKLNRTVYGFFPSPPEVTFDSVLKLFKDLGNHADFVLIQQNVPWSEFENSVDGQSQKRTDIINQVKLSQQNNLAYIFVVDGLNGLNRSEFSGLPSTWDPKFSNPRIRNAYTNFALWVVRTFHPRYLGLASEINTYMDTHPDDAPNFLSLYNEIYGAIKVEAPETRIFVTFQWEELNNLIPQLAGGHQPNHIDWEKVRIFEPKLDLWVISSYPFVAYKSGAEIPSGYYNPLLLQTSKPLGVAEGGYTSRRVGSLPGAPEDQVSYLNAIHGQIGSRLAFWVYLLLNDFDLNSYANAMQAGGQNPKDINTLGMFASVGLRNSDGSPKPAMDLWDSFRNGH